MSAALDFLDKRQVRLSTEIYVIWHDWANSHEATFTDRKKAADYVRRVRMIGPRRLTHLTIIYI